MDENKGVNFDQIDALRRQGEFVKQRIEAVEKLDPRAIAAELAYCFSQVKGIPEASILNKKAILFVEFCKDNGLSTDNVKDLIKLLVNLTSPV